MAAAPRNTGSNPAAGSGSRAAANRRSEPARPPVDDEGEPYFLFEDSDWPGSLGATTDAIS